MRSIPASEIFRTAAGLHGQPWSHLAGEDSISLTDFRMLRPLLSDRLNAAWHLFPWPVLVVIESRRRLQMVYDYATLYGVGQQVFDTVSNRCWHCVQPTARASGNPSDLPDRWAELGDLPYQTTNDPNARFQVGDRVLNPLDGYVYYCIAPDSLFGDIRLPGRFTPLPDFDPAFPLNDLWQEPMEEVMGVWSMRPSDVEVWQLPYWLTDAAVRVEGDPGSAWFRYRIQCPELKGDPWDAEAIYNIDSQTYYTDSSGSGDFWDCITSAQPGQTPGSDPMTWRKIEIPYIFGSYLSRALNADWYELDGQSSRASAASNAAFERLQLEFDKIERQQRQQEPWTVATR